MKISVKRGDLQEHDVWMRHRLAYDMTLMSFSSYFAVLTFGDQYIGDIKTFENFPILPDAFPSTNNEAVNKQYVDYSVTPSNLENLGYLGDGSGQMARGDHGHVNLPTDDQKAALNAADSPTGANPFTVWDQFRDHGQRHIVQDPVPDATIGVSGLLPALDKEKLGNTQFHHSMGELWTRDIGLIISCASNAVDYAVKPLVDGYKSGLPYTDLSNVNGRIIVKMSGEGVYKVDLTASFTANKVCSIHFYLIVNGAYSDKVTFEKYLRNPGDIEAGGSTGFVTLVADDELCVKVRSTVNNTNVTINHFNFNLHRIHE